MDWLTIGVIVGIVAILILAQVFTHAGSEANNGKIACMMPKEQNESKGADLKSERSLRDKAADSGSEKPQEK